MRIDAEARAALEELVREWEECAARYGGYPEASAANQEHGICAEKLAALLARCKVDEKAGRADECDMCGRSDGLALLPGPAKTGLCQRCYRAEVAHQEMADDLRRVNAPEPLEREL